MYNFKQLDKIVSYLIRAEIERVESNFPEAPYSSGDPDFDYWDKNFGDSFSKKFSEIEKEVEKIKKLFRHNVFVFGDISLNQPGYNSYVTSRIHEFAEHWLKNNKEATELEEKISQRLKDKDYYDDTSEGREMRRRDEEPDYWDEIGEEEILQELQLESWQQLEQIIGNLKNYAFISGSSI